MSGTRPLYGAALNGIFYPRRFEQSRKVGSLLLDFNLHEDARNAGCNDINEHVS